MLKIARPVSFLLLFAAFCSAGTTYASDMTATPKVGISQQQKSLKVPVQEVLSLNVENVDSIGNQVVQVRDIWPSDDYLNVRFMLNYPNPQKPILNLVFNEMIPLVDDGYAHLELRYNSNGSAGRLVPGMVSFKLGKYGPSNSSLKGLKVLVKTSAGNEKTYTFSYPLTDEAVPSFTPFDLSELK